MGFAVCQYFSSAEKYRNTAKTIPELADELKVNYVVEGSGQKVGNRILLNIQMIDARRDSHLWARQFEREVTDSFQMPQELAKWLANEIKAIVQREEQKQIERSPTKDIVTYEMLIKDVELRQ